MALEKLGSSLYGALRKILKASVVDEAKVKELIRDIQRSLLQADVNVKLVFEITQRIEERVLKEKLPSGIPRREHVVKVVYEELTRFLGDKTKPLTVKTGKEEIMVFRLFVSVILVYTCNFHKWSRRQLFCLR